MRLHRQKLHDLVLRDACWGLEAGFHWITTGAGGHVLDKRDAQWTTAVLVAREFGCILLVTIHNPDGYKKKTHQWRFRRFRDCQTAPHQCRGTGRSARTGSRHGQPCQSSRRDPPSPRCKSTTAANQISHQGCFNSIRVIDAHLRCARRSRGTALHQMSQSQ